MLDKIGNFIVKAFITTMVFMGVIYGNQGTPEYSILLLLAFMLVLWFIADISFYINNKRMDRKIDRYYRSNYR